MSASPSIDYSCTWHSDCVAKNVGNHCGFYPQCVNAKFCIDETPMLDNSYCGYSTIDACVCNRGKCHAMQSWEWEEDGAGVPWGATVVDDGAIPFEDNCKSAPGNRSYVRWLLFQFHADWSAADSARVLAALACVLALALGIRRARSRRGRAWTEEGPGFDGCDYVDVEDACCASAANSKN